ncbi:uncharacterized protein LOC144167138 isoform X2 [Haemaphysalis longicornis]
MKNSAGLLLVLAIGSALLAADTDAAPRQHCSPHGDVCFSIYDCCSRQCINAMCCDWRLETCPYWYPGLPWLSSRLAIYTVPKPGSEAIANSTTTPVTSTREVKHKPTTPNSV